MRVVPGGAGSPRPPWFLYVVDDSFDYFGSITEWWIDVESSGPAEYPSTISASGLPPVVTDVDVTLTGLRHVWASDVDVLLVGPQGQQATILSDVTGTLSTAQADLTFDDSADQNVPLSIVSGSYRPVNNFGADVFPPPAPAATGASSLSVFNGTNPNGDWRLFVADDSARNAGYVNGWSLRITTEDPPEPTPTPTPTPTASPTPGATPGPGADTAHPRVISTRPAAQATGVRRRADVVAVLDEPVARGTVTRATAYLVRKGATRHVRATITWNPATLRLVIDPRRPLRAGTTYRVVVTTSVADLAGNRLDQDAARAGLQRSMWRFTTR